MRRRIVALSLMVISLSTAGLVSGVPASAAPIDKGHFTDAGSEEFSCDTVSPAIPTHHEFEARINFVFNQRGGPNAFPYYRESVSGSDVYTNLDTGKTYSNTYNITDRDQQVTDNGDGTLTITIAQPGSNKWFDSDGRLLFVTGGTFWFQILVDDGGTPTDPSDDQEIEGSFVVVKDAGHDGTAGRDFCEDLALFTS